MVRTLEVGYWAIGIVIGIGVLTASPFIAGHWIKSTAIPAKTVQQSVTIMGVVAVFQWPLSYCLSHCQRPGDRHGLKCYHALALCFANITRLDEHRTSHKYFFIITLVPAIYFMATRYGAMGAAAVWVTLNSIYMLIGVPLTHHRLLRGEMRRWFIEDIGSLALAAAMTASLGRWLIASPMTPVTAIICLTVILLSALMASASVAPHIRAWLLIQLKNEDYTCLIN